MLSSEWIPKSAVNPFRFSSVLSVVPLLRTTSHLNLKYSSNCRHRHYSTQSVVLHSTIRDYSAVPVLNFKAKTEKDRDKTTPIAGPEEMMNRSPGWVITLIGVVSLSLLEEWALNTGLMVVADEPDIYVCWSLFLWIPPKWVLRYHPRVSWKSTALSWKDILFLALSKDNSIK